MMVKNLYCIPGTDQPEMVPACFVVCSGKKTPEKLHLTNRMVVDWQVRFQKIRYKKDECPFYQPMAQNMLIRTFFGAMKNFHGWLWTDSDFCKFKGLLAGIIEEIYNKRREQWVSVLKLIIFAIFYYFSNKMNRNTRVMVKKHRLQS